MSTQNKNIQTLPLAGIRVVEFVHMVMGPTCGLVLADLGAEVIKVEPTPGGDNTRRLTGSGAGYWMTYNRNKKSFAVDIKSEEGMAAVRKLIESADVVTENFRPGAMEKLGLGYEDVKAIKPDIIYSSMKGFLPGPYEHRTALDEVVQMMTGLAYMTGPEGRPLRAGASVNDVMGGMFSAISILAALWQRKATGEGQFVQTGLFENSAFLVGQHMMQMATTGKPAAPMPSRLSAWAIYDVFSTLDDEQVFMGVVSDSQWVSFCDAFGFDQLGRDPDLAKNTQRVQARSKILPLVKERLASLSKHDVMAMCEQAGLPFSPIQRPQDLFEDLHLNASGGLAHLSLENGEEVKVPMLPFEMNGRRMDARLNVPQLGSHSEELLAEMGYGSGDIESMRGRGIVR
ncbi:CaiB/BaiF CoA transferase family protein [Pseudomonas bijieensis]|uniref:CaiB/BaiF CoA transferase family protein n=1 Tax=Pseudomonas fluorescens TaxID=294 RepID=UPI000CA2E4C3|nr:CaiB/BaiF CoA-transferase family protein [Pseudomonas fluorescens]AUM70577.1 formyl-CoA transferase [Pseudomonas fluorescens]